MCEIKKKSRPTRFDRGDIVKYPNGLARYEVLGVHLSNKIRIQKLKYPKSIYTAYEHELIFVSDSRVGSKSKVKLEIDPIEDAKSRQTIPERVIYNNKLKSTTLLYRPGFGSNNKKFDALTIRTNPGERFMKQKGFLLAYFLKHSGLSRTQSKKFLNELENGGK